MNFRFVVVLIVLSMHLSIFSQVETAKDSANNDLATPSKDIKEQVLKTAREHLVNADFPGSWPMFGTDFRMKIGGYLKADFIYDVDGTLDKNQFLMSTIPVEGQPAYDNEGYISFFAKETRLNVDLRRTTENGLPLQLFIEGDFFSAGNQFRLRHAYITAGDFIIGQTWTTLSFLESMAFMIDFAAGDALFGGRSTQIRYQKQLNDKLKLAIAIENLATLGIENPNNLSGQASLQLPLLALRLDYRWKTGVLFLGSSVAQLRWDGGSNGPKDQTLQYDFVIAGRQYLGDNNYFTYNLSYGDAYGNNIIAFSSSNSNAVLNAEGRLEPMQAGAVMAGFMHRWHPKLESNFNYAYGWLDAPDSRAPFALKRGGVGHLNLIYKYGKNFSVGAEYIWGAQRTNNDAFGNASRIQTMAKFEF